MIVPSRLNENTIPGLSEAPQLELDLRSRVFGYRNDRRSNSIIAREVGYSPAAISSYLSGKYNGDVKKLEERLEAMLRSAPLRKLVKEETFETGVTAAIANALEIIRERNQISVIHGDAGIGKTMGLARFVAENPNALYIPLVEGCCTGAYIKNQILKRVGGARVHRGVRGGQRKSEVPNPFLKMNDYEKLFALLRESNRFIIVDNAHYAIRGARRLLFNLNDEAGVPIVMAGNPELLDLIEKNDQEYSRVGYSPTTITLAEEEIPAAATQLLRLLAPEHADKWQDYAITVTHNKGHLRALRNNIYLALSFMERGVDDPKEAFLAAHSQLPKRKFRLE